MSRNKVWWIVTWDVPTFSGSPGRLVYTEAVEAEDVTTSTFFRWASLASHILISYKTIIGIATRLWFMGSKVGVIRAARMKAQIIAVFRLSESHFGLRIPILAKKVVITGISKTRPIDSSRRVIIAI